MRSSLNILCDKKVKCIQHFCSKPFSLERTDKLWLFKRGYLADISEMNEVGLFVHCLVLPLSARGVHWWSLRNKGSLSYADLPKVDMFYYTIYKTYRGVHLLVSPQSSPRGNQSPHIAVLWRIPPACNQYPGRDTPNRRPSALPVPGLPLQADWRVTQWAAAASASSHMARALWRLLPLPASVLPILTHTTLLVAYSPACTPEDGLLPVQQPQTSSSLAKPANFSAI